MLEKMKKKLLLIDGNSLAFRAFYAMHQQLEYMIAPSGLHTNAIVAFNRFLDGIVDPMHPDAALIAWDAGGGKTTFRGDLYEEYKSGRHKTPDEFLEQIPYLKKLVELHGIKNYELAGYEADDIIGTLAHKAEQDGYEVIIVTGDRDLTQLATENITVNVTKKGVTEIESYTPEYVAEKFSGLTPSQIVEMKALTGDTSDNYPGVTKVGEKTAIKLLLEYHDINNLYANVEDMKKSKLKENLINDKEKAFLAHQLATIKKDAPVELQVSDLTYLGIDFEKLIELYTELNFKTQLSKIKAILASRPELVDENEKIKLEEAKQQDISFVTLTETTVNELAKLKNSQQVNLYIELSNDNYHTADFVGFALGNAEVGYFVTDDINYLKEQLIVDILADANIKKNVVDSKQTIVSLNRLGLKIENIDFDFLLAAYLLDTHDNNSFTYTLAKYGVNIASDEEVYGKGAKYKIPEQAILFNHLVSKIKALSDVKQTILDQLDEYQQNHLYYDIEMPLAKVLAKMEMLGFKVAPEKLLEMDSDLTHRINLLEEQIYLKAGEKFNINSPKQLGYILFEKLELPIVKKTKTGSYSTSVEVLEELEPLSDIITDILNYRQLTKLQSTYVKGILLATNPNDSKVHGRFLQTLTQTGRLSSVEPNLQNIPIKLEEGRQIRKAFVPSHPDWQIFGADYSQIELRVMAHISNDQGMIDAFKHDEDIHTSTARAIFNVPKDQAVDSLQRRHAKAINFGIIYGMSDFGISNSLHISRKDAKTFKETYFEKFPNVKNWIDEIKVFAHDNGYVETLTHRRRYLNNINSKNYILRNAAERTAMNSPIQGTAADIIKIAMIKIDEALENHGLKTRLLLQIHDELVFEGPKEEIEELKELVPKVMDSVMELFVPLKVEVHYGDNWYDAK